MSSSGTTNPPRAAGRGNQRNSQNAASTTAENNNNNNNEEEESFGDKMKRMANNCGQATGLCCFKVKAQSHIAILETKVNNRKKQFGMDYLTLVMKDGGGGDQNNNNNNNNNNKATQEQLLKKCLRDATRDIAELRGKIDEHYDEIDHKSADVDKKIIPGAAAAAAAAGASGSPSTPSANAANQRRPGGNGSPSNSPRRSQPKPRVAAGSNNKSPVKSRNPAKNSHVSGRGGGGGGGGSGSGSPSPKSKTKKPAAGGGGGSSSPALKEEVPEAYRNIDNSKWRLQEMNFQGSASYDTKGKEEVIKGKSIQEGMKRFKANPAKYTAMLYQTSMVKENWPATNHKYTLIHREGTENYRPQGVSPSGWMSILLHSYERVPPFPNNVLPKANRDKYTDAMTFQKRKLHDDDSSSTNKPILPGRGMGVGDTPLLKIIGDVDPSDISQGLVGDCWLLSGISSLAEFDGAIKKLFRKTKNLEQRPLDGPNMYTVTLWDLTTWKEVDIEIDERLACAPDGKGLLASKPSEDGELWVPYLEKALAVHCGGWDKIVGGQCTHAWALMTGCKEQYTIRLNEKSAKYGCYARYNPYEKRWARHANSPHDGETGTWQAAWPKVGGGGDMNLELTQDELFLRLVAWDKQNYIVGAGTKGTSDKHSTGGLVDNHAYSVIESHSNVAGTGIDLLKVRNPWGGGEIEDGEFDDDGPGWNRYPQIKKLLKPVVADDGIFWVTKKEFFHFFQTIYVSASDMTEFLED